VTIRCAATPTAAWARWSTARWAAAPCWPPAAWNWRAPFGQHAVGLGRGFIDAGNAADSFGQLKPEVGYGVGVRWRSPVGPLRLDWARAHKTGKARLHFSVGIAF
jgi:hypothetical protein